MSILGAISWHLGAKITLVFGRNTEETWFNPVLIQGCCPKISSCFFANDECKKFLALWTHFCQILSEFPCSKVFNSPVLCRHSNGATIYRIIFFICGSRMFRNFSANETLQSTFIWLFGRYFVKFKSCVLAARSPNYAIFALVFRGAVICQLWIFSCVLESFWWLFCGNLKCELISGSLKILCQIQVYYSVKLVFLVSWIFAFE